MVAGGMERIGGWLIGGVSLFFIRRGVRRFDG